MSVCFQYKKVKLWCIAECIDVAYWEGYQRGGGGDAIATVGPSSLVMRQFRKIHKSSLP